MCGQRVRPDWSPGDVIYDGGRPSYRITSVIPPDEFGSDRYAGIWTVEPV